MMQAAILEQSSDFKSLRDEIDKFVDELELEMIWLWGQGPSRTDASQSYNHVWSNKTLSRTLIESRDVAEIRSPMSSECRLSQISGLSALTSSTIYNDFEQNYSDIFSMAALTSSKRTTEALLEFAATKEETEALQELLPSEISICCSNIENMRHINMTVHSTLAGKVLPEMAPGYAHPVLVLNCRLGACTWYTCKSAAQLKAFDKSVRSWLDLEHIKLPKLPELTRATSPKQCRGNNRMMEIYIASIVAHLPRLNNHVLSAVARFVQSTPIVPSPIFHSSGYAYIKNTVGYKIRFCVFDNGYLQVYDCPGGKVLKSISLYLSSVQMAEQCNSLSIREFDSEATKIKVPTIISFESDLVCDRWLRILQSATHTKSSFTHEGAALPYTLTSWGTESD